MAEQIYRSPGFFQSEIDLSESPPDAITGTPAGLIGTADKGPAFVPITVGNFADFVEKFGNLNSDYFAPYAVQQFLQNRNALTFTRVLGAGANSTTSDFTNVKHKSSCKNVQPEAVVNFLYLWWYKKQYK